MVLSGRFGDWSQVKLRHRSVGDFGLTCGRKLVASVADNDSTSNRQFASLPSFSGCNHWVNGNDFRHHKHKKSFAR